VQDFNPAYVADGSIASDRHARAARATSSFTPIASKRRQRSKTTRCANRRHMQCSKPTSLFDHLVGKCEQLVGDGQAERLRGGEIEHELELGRLNHRQVGGL
jgi:hypothetical protein